jgi:hypothetical protein
MKGLSLVTVLIAKGILIFIPLGVRDSIRPGAVRGQKRFIEFATLQGACLTANLSETQPRARGEP